MEPEETLKREAEADLRGFIPELKKRTDAWSKRGILAIGYENRPKSAMVNPKETPEEAKKRAFIFLTKQHGEP
jgi:hypothetical protein